MPENKPWEDVFDKVFPFQLSRQLPDGDTKVAPEQPPEKDGGRRKRVISRMDSGYG